MGFMDKAKKLAEQAQEKLDETQKNFNKSNSPQGQPQEGGVKYDEHGRPIQEAPPAGATAPPAAEPTPPAPPVPDPTAPVEGATGGPPASEPPAAEPAAPTAPAPPASKPAEGGGANASPDPFKPIQ